MKITNTFLGRFERQKIILRQKWELTIFRDLRFNFIVSEIEENEYHLDWNNGHQK